MFPFILAITCMLLVQFYSIIFARKWRQECTSYRSELFKHLLSHYDLIHRTTNTQSNYHEGNSCFGPLSKALEKNTRRGEEASFPFLPRARASSLKKKHWHLLYSFKNFELYLYPKTDVKKPTC